MLFLSLLSIDRSVRYLLIFMAFFLFLPAPATAWPGRIVAVLDGDTIDVEPSEGGQHIRVRLYGIDAPEKRQTGGESAKGFVFGFLYHSVDVAEQDKSPDRYGRVVAIIHLPDGDTLQAAILRAGFAWVWPRYCKNCQSWQELHDDARVSRRGLWAAPNPMAPWLWRQQKRDARQSR